MSNDFFSSSENRALYDKMSKNVLEIEVTNDITIWRIRVSCRINRATRTQEHAHAHAPRHPPTQTQARTHARTGTTYTYKYFLLFHSNSDTRTRFSATLYVHCLPRFVMSDATFSSCWTALSAHVWFSSLIEHPISLARVNKLLIQSVVNRNLFYALECSKVVICKSLIVTYIWCRTLPLWHCKR